MSIEVGKSESILTVTFPSGHQRKVYGFEVKRDGVIIGIVEHMSPRSSWEAITVSGESFNFRTRKDAVKFIVEAA